MHFIPKRPEEKAAAAAAEAQLVAYNARDIDAFCRCYADDVEVFMLGGPAAGPDLTGIAAFRARYDGAFKREPRVHCAIEHRHVFGKFATDYEHLTGFKDGREVRAVAIYETEGERIRRVWFLKAQ